MRKNNITASGQGIIEVLAVIFLIVVAIYFIAGWIQQLISFGQEKYLEYNNGRPAQSIIFAGKLVNVVTNEWPNNRLVILFLNGKEVARTDSKTGEFYGSSEGTHDGLFVLQVENDYKLTANDFNYSGNHGVDFTWNSNDKWPFSTKYSEIYRWFGDYEEGTLLNIPLPGKNLKFSIYAFEEPIDKLPASFMEVGAMTLKYDGVIYINGLPVQQTK